MSTSLTFLGAAGFVVEGPHQRILIDPFLTNNPMAPCGPDELGAPDVILVSHAAHDHLGDTAAIARRTGAPVVCDDAVARLLVEAGMRIRPVECHHWSVGTLADGHQVVGTPLAFVLETEPGVRLYHYGDTAIFDMTLIGSLYAPTVALLGCTVPSEIGHLTPGAGRIVSGEMDADECARVAEMLGVRLAVACHYLEPDEEVARFLRLVPEYDTTGVRRALAPRVGETIELVPAELALS